MVFILLGQIDSGLMTWSGKWSYLSIHITITQWLYLIILQSLAPENLCVFILTLTFIDCKRKAGTKK